jgi:hypothetical protein
MALPACKPRGLGVVPRCDGGAVLIDGHDAAPGLAVQHEDPGRADGEVVDVADP